MNSEVIKNNDPIQLKQMIIFLRAELSKFEHKVKEYENSFHYSVIENLELENEQLTIEKNELTRKLHEMRRKKHTLPADTSWKLNTEWLPVNKRLHEVKKKLKDDVNTDKRRRQNYERQLSSLHKKITEHNSTIKQLEYRLVDLIQKENNKVHTQITNLSGRNEVQLQFEDERQRFIKEIESKSNQIEVLQREIIDSKEQKESETLLQLENQIKNALAKSAEYDEKLDTKLDLFEDERHRFIKEIEGKNNQIEMLQSENIDLKEQKESETLLQLENQIKDALAKSVEYDEKLDTKLDVFEDERHRFIKEVEDRNKVIGKLRNEISVLKEQKESETLLQLENQIKDALAKSAMYDERLDTKLEVFKDERHRFIKEIEGKNNKVEVLQREIIDLKEQKESETLLQLENQFKEMLAKSAEYDEKLDTKFDVFENERQRFIKEVEDKNNVIGKLRNAISDLKEQNITLKEKVATTALAPELLLQLEHQIKDLLAKSQDYEENLDAKLTIINDLEHKLDLLTQEIEDIEVQNAAKKEL